jgi:prevent-host-death family protein
MKRMTASKFKATCLILMDEVAHTGEPVEITKRGKCIVRLVALSAKETAPHTKRSIFGAAKASILYLAPDEELLSTGAVWNATR